MSQAGGFVGADRHTVVMRGPNEVTSLAASQHTPHTLTAAVWVWGREGDVGVDWTLLLMFIMFIPLTPELFADRLKKKKSDTLSMFILLCN